MPEKSCVIPARQTESVRCWKPPSTSARTVLWEHTRTFEFVQSSFFCEVQNRHNHVDLCNARFNYATPLLFVIVASLARRSQLAPVFVPGSFWRVNVCSMRYSIYRGLCNARNKHNFCTTIVQRPCALSRAPPTVLNQGVLLCTVLPKSLIYICQVMIRWWWWLCMYT